MALSINNNLMALTAFNNLSRSYSDLSKSVNRLSSGLRINSASDDAAGLAVRELMRSDIAVLNQGMRNANDAISMLQTMDGAAQVIDEKLIRMKELAEQAATGTYSSEQRGIMNDEFQAMADEIERIAVATDFNGIKMLNTDYTAAVSGSSAVAAAFDVSGETDTALSATGLIRSAFSTFASGDSIVINYTTSAGAAASANITLGSGEAISDLLADIEACIAGVAATWTSGTGLAIAAASAGATSLSFSTITDGTSSFSFTETTAGSDAVAAASATGQVKIHFGTGNDSTEDYYYIHKQDMSKSGLGISGISISTQASAQGALGTIDSAILSKDVGRAHFGATINRLENTVSNLTIQSENIQAAESQISDVDVAHEMTMFINNQIKSQAGVAMLAQANMLPQLAMQLLGG